MVAYKFARKHHLAIRDVGDELQLGAAGCTDWECAPVVRLHSTAASI